MRLIRLLKRDLAKEASTWVDDAIITADQARAICQKYDVDYDSTQGASTGYRVLVSLGFLFIGLAVITLLGANWDEIPRGLRMAGLVLITLGTHGIALRQYLADRESGAVGLFFLGNLFYGASIILIAQIYHLGEHMPDGVFWWALGSLPFALLLKSAWLMMFSLVLALVWFFIETGMGFFPTLFPVFIAAALYVVVYGHANNLLFLTLVASIGLWFETSLSMYWATGSNYLDVHIEHIPVSVALFILAYAFSHWLQGRDSTAARDYAVLLSLWTLRFGLLAMLVLSYEEPWREILREEWNHLPSMWLIVGLLLAGAFALAWLRHKLATLLPITVFFLVTMILLLLSGGASDALYFQVVYNIALVTSGIWLIVRGMRGAISHYFFLGVSVILLTALMRYVDLIGEYVGGAALFILLAAVLLGAARYWKKHHEREAKQ